jgi:hypothetical protein
MNTTNNTATSTPPAPQRGEPRDVGGQQRSADFERLLREKSAARDEDADAEDESSTPQSAVAGVVSWLAPLPLKAHARQDAAGVAGADAARSEATAAALPSAPAGETAVLLAGKTAEAAGAWEVTLRQPLGVAVDVRASRSTDAVNGWALSIGSPTLDASMLARHAPRLNERLKARALSNTHARIEESDGERP